MTQLTKKDTITSLELLKEINMFRRQERFENQNDSRLLKDCLHDSLLKTIREEFYEEIGIGELNESHYIHEQNKQKYPMFVLTLSQAKQVLLKESKYVRKSVLKYIERLEEELKKNLTVEEMIIAQAQSMIDVKKDIQRLEHKFDTVVTLESGKQRKIQLAVATRVYSSINSDHMSCEEDYKKEVRKLFTNIYRDIKRKFGVASYKDIKVVEYEKALNFIENWIEDKEVI